MAPSFRYPKKVISNSDDYLKIQVIRYKPPGLNSTEGFGLGTTEEALISSNSINEPQATIILPMPQNIQDNNSADWTTGTLNPLASALGSAASDILSGENPISAAMKKFGNVVDLTQTGEGQQGIIAGSVAGAIKAALGQGEITPVLSRGTGMVFNENVELLFNGVTMRPAYNFTFDMVPRSKNESDEIKAIIRTFKKNMLPQRGNKDISGGGLFVQAPNVFKLEYMSGGKEHPFLHKFKPCALTQMSVNYNGSTQYATYPDATPVHMQLALQFQELSPIYAEDYKDSDKGVGY